MSKKSSTHAQESASNLIDERIRDLGDWRGKTLAKVRKIIREADPEIIEEVKWRKPTNPQGVPVWSRNGGICTGETYKDHLKFTFFRGASISDPSHIFTQAGSLRRAIDFYEGDSIDEEGLKKLVRSAIALNVENQRKP